MGKIVFYPIKFENWKNNCEVEKTNSKAIKYNDSTIIIDFEKWLISENLSERTIEYYVKKLKMFFKYCTIQQVENVEINTDIVRGYIEYLRARENFTTKTGTLASSTRAKHFDVIKRYSDFLLEKRYISESPMNGIRRPIARYKVIEGLSREQLHALMNAILEIRASLYNRQRNVLIVFLLAGTGLRISEAIKLKPIDFNFYQRKIKVLGKGDREREVPFGPEIARAMEWWIETQNIEREEFLWKTRTGRVLTPQGFGNVLKRAQALIGADYEIDRIRVSPHTLRHTFAKFWVIKNGNTIALSKVLGHTTTQMTDKYVNMWGTDIVEAYDECSPLNGVSVPLNFD